MPCGPSDAEIDGLTHLLFPNGIKQRRNKIGKIDKQVVGENAKWNCAQRFHLLISYDQKDRFAPEDRESKSLKLSNVVILDGPQATGKVVVGVSQV